MDEQTKREILAKLEWTQAAVNRLADELAFLNNLLDRAAELPLERNAQQGGQHLDSSYDEYEGTTFNPKKVSARPNR